MKSVLSTKATKELELAIADELAKSGENAADEAEKFESLLKGAESPKPGAAQQD